MKSFEKVQSDIFAHYDAAEIDPGSPLVQSLLECIHLLEPEKTITVFPGGCDARHLINRYHVPAVIFGPSKIHLAHAENEYLNLDQWQLAIQELALFITRWCSGAPLPDKISK
jgi:acetylornithine deacetylase